MIILVGKSSKTVFWIGGDQSAFGKERSDLSGHLRHFKGEISYKSLRVQEDGAT